MIKVGPVEIEDEKLAEVCRQYHVGQLAVLGSSARGEARRESDIEVLLEFLPGSEVGLLDYTGLMTCQTCLDVRSTLFPSPG